jgi:hypothetical protein
MENFQKINKWVFVPFYQRPKSCYSVASQRKKLEHEKNDIYTCKNLAIRQLLRRRSQDTDALRKRNHLRKSQEPNRINTSKMHFLFVFVLNAPFKSFSCFSCVKQKMFASKYASIDFQ